jgi:hypothetical protein
VAFGTVFRTIVVEKPWRLLTPLFVNIIINPIFALCDNWPLEQNLEQNP